MEELAVMTKTAMREHIQWLRAQAIHLTALDPDLKDKDLKRVVDNLNTKAGHFETHLQSAPRIGYLNKGKDRRQ